MIFNFSIVQVHFVFLLIEFNYPFSIFYKIPRDFVYYYCILSVVIGCRDFFFFMAALLLYILAPLFFPSSVSFFSHPCCSNARVFGKTLVLEFPISYSHTE